MEGDRSSTTPMLCPVCSTQLDIGHKSGLTTWQCPSAHGVGIYLVEAYGHLQRDEIENILLAAQDAPVSPLRSPLSGFPMLEVTFDVDGRSMEIEVDVAEHFGWFSLDELRSMPLNEQLNSEVAKSELVGLGAIDRAAGENESFVARLEPEDFETGLSGSEPSDEQTSGMNRFFGALTRRLRS